MQSSPALEDFDQRLEKYLLQDAAFNLALAQHIRDVKAHHQKYMHLCKEIIHAADQIKPTSSLIKIKILATQRYIGALEQCIAAAKEFTVHYNARGQNLLHHLAKLASDRYIWQAETTIRQWLDHCEAAGIDFHEKNPEGYSPMDISLNAEHYRMSQMLAVHPGYTREPATPIHTLPSGSPTPPTSIPFCLADAPRQATPLGDDSSQSVSPVPEAPPKHFAFAPAPISAPRQTTPPGDELSLYVSPPSDTSIPSPKKHAESESTLSSLP